MNNMKQQLGLHTELAQQIGAFLARKRKRADLTLRGLGDKLGVQHTLVDKIEKGVREISLLEFIHICQTLGLSEIEIFRDISKLYHEHLEAV